MEHIFAIFVLQQPCVHSLKKDHSAGTLRYELSVDTLYVK